MLGGKDEATAMTLGRGVKLRGKFSTAGTETGSGEFTLGRSGSPRLCGLNFLFREREYVVVIKMFEDEGLDLEEVSSVGSILRALWHLLREESTPFATELQDIKGDIC